MADQYIHTCIHTYIWLINIYIHVYTCKYMYIVWLIVIYNIHTCTCTYIWVINIYIHVYAFVCMGDQYLNTCIIHLCMGDQYLHTCTCICMYVWLITLMTMRRSTNWVCVYIVHSRHSRFFAHIGHIAIFVQNGHIIYRCLSILDGKKTSHLPLWMIVYPRLCADIFTHF